MSFDWTQYKGNLSWLPERTIYITLHGSHAYGTSTPESDTDYRGIAIAPKDYYFGYLKTFEQSVQNEPVDLAIFEVRRFFKLAADANPNALELLYTDPSAHKVVTGPARVLLDNRDLFLSRKCKHTFSGYARSQLQRIRTHKAWLNNPLTERPNRAEFGLTDKPLLPQDQLQAAMAAITKQLDRWSLDFMDHLDRDLRIVIVAKIAEYLAEIGVSATEQFAAAARLVGYEENFILMLDKERRYNAKVQHYQQYQAWLKTRNRARAELETKYGFDSKHGAHLVRLLRACRELLTTGQLIVQRPDADELKAIRNGAMSYTELVEWAERQDRELDELMIKSPLPREPDRARLDRLCFDLVSDALK
jgi:predicted nucleotidyltransferase